MINRPNSLSRFSAYLVFGLFGLLCAQGVSHGARIHSRLTSDETYVLAQPRPAAIVRSIDLGPIDSSAAVRVKLYFSRTAEQERSLQRLLTDQQDRSSSEYHHWLTPEKYGAQFGLPKSDTQKVTAWLEGLGFTNVQIGAGGTWVEAAGQAEQARLAFGANLHRYAAGGETHYANVGPLQLPRALEGVVSHISGLDNFRPRPRLHARYTSATSGAHFIAPTDLAAIYDIGVLYQQGVDGSGQKVAVAGQSDIDMTQIRSFRVAAGLPSNDPQVLLDGPDPGWNDADQQEAEADLEWVGGVAKGASVIYVNSDNAFDSLTYAIDQALAPVISMSYGECEADLSSIQVMNAELEKAAAEGITVIAPSGDNGAADCDVGGASTQGLAVDFPASSPYVTGVGGTELHETGTEWLSNGSASGYIPEQSWNDKSGISGGGSSSVFGQPVWQIGEGVPTGNRSVPDISLAASVVHDGYLSCSASIDCTTGWQASDGTLDIVGGTSLAAPVFAGIVTLLNQHANTAQGLINPRLYILASFSDAFHDITVGTNELSCHSGSKDCVNGEMGYTAGPGYDRVTGLGSVDAGQLIEGWAADFSLSGPTTLTVNRGASSSGQVQVSATGDFTGTVALSCTVSSNLPDTTCQVPANVGTGAVQVTVANSSTSAVIVQRVPNKPVWTGAMMIVFVLTLCFWKRRPALKFAFILPLVLVVAGCGGGEASSSSGSSVQTTSTPPVSGSVTITGQAGALSHKISIPVTLQ